MSDNPIERMNRKEARRGVLFAGALALLVLGFAAFLLAVLASRRVAEPPSQAWIAAWLGAALTAVCAFWAVARRQRPGVAAMEPNGRPARALREAPAVSALPTLAATSTPLELLPDARLAAAETPEPADPLAPAGPPGRRERCAALRAGRRFDDAARLALEGLAGDDEAGPLLIELSWAEFERGRVDAALEAARDAHFVSRSRETLAHLLRLLIQTRRFTPEDGPTLQRAVRRHPEQSLLRHALGVFEAMHGAAATAEKELRTALRLEVDADARRSIVRDLARVQSARADEAGATG